jgi:bacterial/archaeal transporter family protein
MQFSPNGGSRAPRHGPSLSRVDDSEERPGGGGGAMAWLIPTLGCAVALGVWGVAGKLALRSLAWGDLLLINAVIYALAAIVLLAIGRAGVHLESNSWWALLAAVSTVSALVLFYLALEAGEATKVVPITAAYPAVTLVLAAILLAENVSLVKVGGMALVVVGVIVLSVAD